ncbi:MAG: DUF1236 domain-containing protein [Bauldia sp.]|uniref:DUF1236 domain-containing protein n=1 Tax=Bauldia sp. TaxID=2575872 RepID=UPI001D6DA7E9|nr:DUF1236 domain-containing protein [Bauldia sp.]MCB1496106.1 DUF1236 domain-containing protein [Bauldia sp.]
MTYPRFLTIAATAAAVFVGGEAALAFVAFSNADLNLRSGPSTHYPIVATTNHKDRLDVSGCLEDVSWCVVSWGGVEGWASAEYIDVDETDGVKTLPLAKNDMGIPVVTYTAVDAVQPTFVGTVTPVSAYVEAISPPAAVTAFVSAQTIETVHVQGEVVVGAVLPETVPLFAIPQSKYTFSRVNGQNVVVDTSSRQVVYVHRSI